MMIKIDDADAKGLARQYPEGPDRTGESTLALYRVCQQVRDKMPRPFEKGDIVHIPNSDASWCGRMEVLAVARDDKGMEWAWCHDHQDAFGAYLTADLAHGERP